MRLETGTIWGTSTTDSILVSERMTLGELLNGLEVVQLTPASHDPNGRTISSLEYDSRRASGECVFFALPGVKTDGNRFVGQAVSRGAVAVVSEQPRPADLDDSVIWIRVTAARRALALAAGNFYAQPSQALDLVGVTGTNGKTTTTFLIDSILRAAGRRTGLFGTVLYRTPGRAALASNTTPESLELARLLAELRDEGGTAAVLEVSSHALAMDRVWGFRFAAAVFTNLTRDHLDFHETMDNYFAAKRVLFEGTGAGAPRVGVINGDDPRGRELTGLCERTLTYGLAEGADVRASEYRLSTDGLEFTAGTPAGEIELRSRLVGRFNVSNILAATATAVALGVDHRAIAEGIARMTSVPGRFERVEAGQPFLVVVDYAHTDDALVRLIETARELKLPGRILALFGAGGDRDRTKRPLMGEAAGRGADLVVVTSDNPRSEDPQAIVNDILPGVERTGTPHLVEVDRALAIEKILAEARPGDMVLIAGKGHETYQILGDRTIAFDDRHVARQALRSLGYRPEASRETEEAR
jgi:UDP-N-acetylmuramoyl-L-alanyl-D-glutamate--2,6-diaminopimelate ligase